MYYKIKANNLKRNIMRTLSQNRNGKVVKTNNKGFSSSREFKRIEKFLKENGIEYNFDRSKEMSSFYLDFVIKNIWLNIRISDHTKRNEDLEKVEKLNNETFKKIEDKNYYAGSLQILNSEMFKEVFQVLKSI